MTRSPNPPHAATQPDRTAVPAAKRSPLTRSQWITLILILTVGTFLRFCKIGLPNMWLDEIWAVELSMGHGSVHDHLPLGMIQDHNFALTSLANAAPWWSVWTHLGGLFHPPLFYVILRLWMDVFGTGTAAARSLSALISSLTLLVFFDTCRLVQRVPVALLATALMAVAVAQIDFAQQTRDYTLLILLALCCGNIVLRMENSGATPTRCIMLVLLISALALTHYFAAPVIVALTIYVAIRFRGRNRRLTLGAFPLAAVLFLCAWGRWLFDDQKILASQGNSLFLDPDTNVSSTLVRLAVQPAKFVLGEQYIQPLYTTDARMDALYVIAIATCVIPLAFIFIRSRRRGTLFWGLWLLMTLGFIAALDLIQHTRLLTMARYTLLASPAVYALAVSYEWPSRPLLRHLIAFAMIACISILAIRRAGEGFPDIGDMHQMAGLIDRNVPADGLVVFYNGSPWATPGCWYMGWQYYSPGSERKWMALMSPADVGVNQQLKGFDSIWCVSTNPAPNWPAIFPGWTAAPAPEHEQDCSAGSITHLQRAKSTVARSRSPQ